MNFRDRLFVNVKSTSFKTLLFMSVIYGVIFGGISEIENFISGQADVKDFVFAIIANIIIYGSMFLFIIILIYNIQGLKMLLTIGISQKNLAKCWRDFHLHGFLIGMIGATIVLMLSQIEASTYLSSRLLDVDLNNPGIFGYLKYLVAIMMLFTFLMGILNIVAQVGNHFGWRWVVNTVIGIAGILLLAIPPMIKIIVWGQRYWLMLSLLMIATVAMITISYQLVGKMEVKR